MFTTVTKITANAGKTDEVKNFCLSLNDRIRQEPGCLNHQLYIDEEVDTCFVMITAWENEEAWQTHISSPWQRELAEQASSDAGQQLSCGWSSQHLREISA